MLRRPLTDMAAATGPSSAAVAAWRPRRVLMTVDAVGGVWRYAIDAARALNDRGVAVLIAGLGPVPSPAQAAESAELAATELLGLDEPLDWMVDDERALDGLAPTLARLVEQEGIDLVHLNVPSQAAGLALDVPVAVTSHSCVVTWWNAVRGGPLPADWSWQRERNRRGLEAADVVMAPSRSHAEALTRAYGPMGAPTVVPNAVHPGPTGGDKQAFVLAAGRWWDAGKNGAALDLAAASCSWPVRMAGATRGPNGEASEPRHAEALGELPGSVVRSLMAEAAIVACPSLYEPFGLAALEAGLAGAALVLADIPTFREIWTGAAVFADPRDPAALSAAIDGLAADPARRADLGAAARRRASAFTAERQCEALLAAYEEARQRHAARSSGHGGPHEQNPTRGQVGTDRPATDLLAAE